MESRPPPETLPTQAPPVATGRRHVTRRTLALSVAAAMAVVVIAAVALGALGGPIALPAFLPSTESPSTEVQTSSQITTTQESGPALHVLITIARKPISPGSTQIFIVAVSDPNGNPVPEASVRIEILSPTGNRTILEGLTGTDGQYARSWHVPASSESIGTFQVAVSATKAGYRTGQAQATFKAA